MNNNRSEGLDVLRGPGGVTYKNVDHSFVCSFFINFGTSSFQENRSSVSKVKIYPFGVRTSKDPFVIYILKRFYDIRYKILICEDREAF